MPGVRKPSRPCRSLGWLHHCCRHAREFPSACEQGGGKAYVSASLDVVTMKERPSGGKSMSASPRRLAPSI